MFSAKKCDLPKSSLLRSYRDSGAYTDCYSAEVDGAVSQREYIQAFYTTLPFKLERAILKWAVSKPSSDVEAVLLAEAKTDRFAAWYVEARTVDQILLSDYRERTRSWLMSERLGGESSKSTRIYFGSAVVPIETREPGDRRMGRSFSVLLQFHKLYSQILLSSAHRRLLRLAHKI